jgi:hypothetical protein
MDIDNDQIWPCFADQPFFRTKKSSYMM